MKASKYSIKFSPGQRRAEKDVQIELSEACFECALPDKKKKKKSVDPSFNDVHLKMVLEK